MNLDLRKRLTNFQAQWPLWVLGSFFVKQVSGLFWKMNIKLTNAELLTTPPHSLYLYYFHVYDLTSAVSPCIAGRITLRWYNSEVPVLQTFPDFPSGILCQLSTVNTHFATVSFLFHLFQSPQSACSGVIPHIYYKCCCIHRTPWPRILVCGSTSTKNKTSTGANFFFLRVLVFSSVLFSNQ